MERQNSILHRVLSLMIIYSLSGICSQPLNADNPSASDTIQFRNLTQEIMVPPRYENHIGFSDSSYTPIEFFTSSVNPSPVTGSALGPSLKLSLSNNRTYSVKINAAVDAAFTPDTETDYIENLLLLNIYDKSYAPQTGDTAGTLPNHSSEFGYGRAVAYTNDRSPVFAHEGTFNSEGNTAGISALLGSGFGKAIALSFTAQDLITGIEGAGQDTELNPASKPRLNYYLIQNPRDIVTVTILYTVVTDALL